MSDRELPFSLTPSAGMPPGPGPLHELIERVRQHALSDGLHTTAITPLALIRASAPTLALPTVYEPGLCIVVQGSKQATLGRQVFHYDPLHCLVISVTLPLVGQILQATPERPYLCVRLNLDANEIAALMLEAPQPAPTAPVGIERGLRVAPASAALLDAVLRLLRILNTPQDLPVLAPLVMREIHYRALTGELGPRLRELAVADSHSQRIARAIEWIKHRYAEPMRIEDLADAAHMSASSLHHHFKQVTTLSPLQFQKHMRLHQARRLMLSEGLDAAVAGHRVGYESASQFSREYRRLFGAPPRAEISQVRNGSSASPQADDLLHPPPREG